MGVAFRTIQGQSVFFVANRTVATFGCPIGPQNRWNNTEATHSPRGECPELWQMSQRGPLWHVSLHPALGAGNGFTENSGKFNGCPV